MSTRPAIKVLRTEIGRGGQEVRYAEVLRIGPHTCQICIKSDSYDFQSFAVANVWSREALCWNKAASIHYSYAHRNEAGVRRRQSTERESLSRRPNSAYRATHCLAH
jgi:hypothetical protein